MKRSESPDPLERLLQASGRRPAVPAERRARVRAAAHGRWQSRVASNPGRPWIRPVLALAGAAAAAALAISLWPSWIAPTAPTRAGVVQLAGASAGPRQGDPILAGASLATGEGDRMAIRMDQGHSLRLDVATRVRVLGPTLLQLEQGAVYVDSAAPGRPLRPQADGTGAPSSGGIEIRTPYGSVRDLGTQFEVRLADDAVQVRVREGRVALASTAVELQVAAGEELRLDAGGRQTRDVLSAHDERWSWILAAAPPVDLQGLSLMDYLTWSARERGLRLDFASDRLAAAASGFDLSGSLAAMSPDEALESVLLTSGMTCSIDDGRLIVRDAGDAAP